MEKQKGIMMYEGLDGIKSAFNHILGTLKKDDEYLVFALGIELSKKSLVNFFLDYHNQRVIKDIKVRLIADESLHKTFFKHYMVEGLRVKYSKVKLPTGIFIYGDNVMSVIWEETHPIAFIITSDKNAEKYKLFFEEIWKFALNP